MSKQKWFEIALLDKVHPEIKKYDTTYRDVAKRWERVQTKRMEQQKKGLNVPISDDEDDDDFDKSSRILGRDIDSYEKNAHCMAVIICL